MKPEALLATRCSNYMQINHGDIIVRWDIAADVPLPIGIAKRNKALQGSRWNTGYPDTFLATCRGGYGGLYIELKATKKLTKSKHTDRQKFVHAHLRKHGYKVEFVFSLEEFIEVVEDYLKG